MNSIVGQDNLIAKISDVNPFPQVVAIIGEEGAGKHLLVDYINNNILNSTTIDITNIINSDLISSLYTEVLHRVYVCNIDECSERCQNTLLKFIEEPPTNCNIIVLSTSKSSIIITLLNRLYTFYMEPYTKEVLEKFIDRSSKCFSSELTEVITSICNTPGQVKNLNYCILEDMQKICYAIITHLDKASFPNTLTIGDKMNYGEEYDKFDIRAFFALLTNTLYDNYVDTKNVNIYNYYMLTKEYTTLFSNSNLNRKYLVDNFLTKLWRMSRCN